MLPMSFYNDITEQGNKTNDGTATYKDFLKLQNMIAHIQDCYKENILNRTEYESLKSYAFLVQDAMRTALRRA